MKRQFNKIMSFVLAAVMIFGVMPAGMAFAADIVKDGSCGDNLTWTLDSEGTLTISGTGKMDKGESDFFPWHEVSENITSVIVENGVTYISGHAFDNCINLKSIKLPDVAAWVEENAFEDTAYYKDPNNWDNNVLYIDGYLIKSENLSASQYYIQDETKVIADRAFIGNGNLETIYIPNSVKIIGAQAFDGCMNLTNISIPGSVNQIGMWAFSSTAYYYDDSNWENDMLYIDNWLICANDKITGSCSIKTGTTHIANAAFLCDKIESIAIPYGVKEISANAFSECRKLKSVKIPNSVTKIGSYAFGICYNLESVDIPNSVIEIEDRAFYICGSMKSVTIPSSVERIGKYAFGYEYSYGKNKKYDDFVIKGYKGTAAEKYAKDNTFAFVDLSHTHSYKATVTKKATCTANGVMKYTCSCGSSYTKAIKATGHKYTTTTAKSTLTKDGSTVTKCTVCGAVKSKTAIASVKTVSLSKTSFTYNGKIQKPSVVVKDRTGKTLKNGTDYTVKYSSGCKNVGQYTVTVTFKGKYSGSKTLTFKIVPKGTSISKLTAGKKQFTAKWSAQTAQTTGYELQYSTSSSMSGAKKVTVGKNKTTSSTVKKLKGKKKYYVRVRTYKTVKVNGKNVKIYSAWSKMRNIKTK